METASTSQSPEKPSVRQKLKREAEWFDVDEEHNTSVYVSGLPTDKIDEEVFLDLMKKYGIIAKKALTGSPYSIKLYKNDDGSYKGDGTCRYARKESADLAVDLLDGYLFEGSTIHCERAQFKLKGTYDPSKKPRVDPRAKIKQKKVIEKLTSWETKEPTEVKQKKVILKNMFSPSEISEQPEMLIGLKDDMEYKCSQLEMNPKRVDVYDKHPEGVVAITFSEHEEAIQFVDAVVAEPWYAGNMIEATLWDGKTNYKIKETDEESEERLERWKRDIQDDVDAHGKNASDLPVNLNPACSAEEAKVSDPIDKHDSET